MVQKRNAFLSISVLEQTRKPLIGSKVYPSSKVFNHMSKVLSKPCHSQIVQTLNLRRGRLLPFAHNSVGIITHCNINCDKMNLNLLVLVALLNVIPSAVAGNTVQYSLLQIRLWSAVKDALIHPRPFSGNVTVTQEKLKNLKMLRSSFVKACLKKAFLITL